MLSVSSLYLTALNRNRTFFPVCPAAQGTKKEHSRGTLRIANHRECLNATGSQSADEDLQFARSRADVLVDDNPSGGSWRLLACVSGPVYPMVAQVDSAGLVC